MEPPASTPKLPKEARIMAALDAICHRAEAAMKKVQDDSRVSGPQDKTAILRELFAIDAKLDEIRELLRPSGTYSSVRLDGDSDP